ncbi:MAG: chemotaxis protein CheD [Bacteroidales bacterium]|nr:chemotaxis protein CheD [Bacteroidales bacterium]
MNQILPGNIHFLYPSTIFASHEEWNITTILGSCVAVCFWDPIIKAGAMNHYMLPLWNGQGLASPKYGNIAIKKSVEKMIQIGCRIENIKAKVFGGAEVLNSKNTQFNIGDRNVEIARIVLDELGIPIVSSSTGGKRGRKILFNTATGDVKHKLIKPPEPSEILNNLPPTAILYKNNE